MQVLGFYSDSPYIHLAVLEKRGGNIEVRSIKTFLNNAGANVKQLYIPGWKGKIATAISSLIRPIDLPKGSESEIAKGIPFKVESLSPLPLSKIAYFLSRGKKNSQLFIVAKEKLEQHLQSWNQLEIEPDLTTSTAQAQFRFFRYKFPDIASAILVHLGGEEWSCLVIENHQIVRCHTIPFGINDLLQAFWEDRKRVLFESEIEGAAKKIDLLQLKAHLNPSLSKAIERGKERLNQALCSFAQNGSSKPIVFTGRVDAFSHLKECLTDIPAIDQHLSTQEALCALSIGMGLEMFSNDPVQFLTGDFYPKRLLCKVGAWSCGALIFSLAGALAISGMGVKTFSSNKDEMASSLQTLLNRSEIGLGDRLFEQTKEKGFALAASFIQQSAAPAYFLTNHFSVASFLQQLTAHPLFDSMQINQIEYEMVSYPKIGDETAPYQVKIQLELETENSIAARKFHELLLSGEWIADSSEEVQWDNAGSSIRTSFILREL